MGESGTPPSLHRYLYAYSNPTVYVDLYGYDATVVGGSKSEKMAKRANSSPDSSFYNDYSDSAVVKTLVKEWVRTQYKKTGKPVRVQDVTNYVKQWLKDNGFHGKDAKEKCALTYESTDDIEDVKDEILDYFGWRYKRTYNKKDFDSFFTKGINEGSIKAGVLIDISALWSGAYTAMMDDVNKNVNPGSSLRKSYAVPQYLSKLNGYPESEWKI